MSPMKLVSSSPIAFTGRLAVAQLSNLEPTYLFHFAKEG